MTHAGRLENLQLNLREPIFNQGPERVGCVGPPDLFACFLGSRHIGDGDLEDGFTQAQRLGRHLGTELKAGALQVHAQGPGDRGSL